MIIEKANKHFGEIVGNTYFTDRKPNHFMRMFNGFGISDDTLKELKEREVVWILITYYGVNGIKKLRFQLKQYLESYKVYLYRDPLQRFGGQPDLQRFVDVREVFDTK